MELKVLGSSSKGNCYLLDNGIEALMIECGVAFREVQKAVDFDINRIAGCIISHEHQDHCKEVCKCLDAQLHCYMSEGTSRALSLNANNRMLHTMKPLQSYRIGRFIVKAFNVEHDACEPFGFLISHTETGLILFATDTYYLRYRFRGLSNILIECNYRLDILDERIQNAKISLPQRNRTIKSHMSYETCLNALMSNDLSAVHNIVLIHLSDSNSDAVAFSKGIAEATGKSVHIAIKNMIINFNKTPF